jgi:hypothetical protein
MARERAARVDCARPWPCADRRRVFVRASRFFASMALLDLATGVIVRMRRFSLAARAQGADERREIVEDFVGDREDHKI